MLEGSRHFALRGPALFDQTHHGKGFGHLVMNLIMREDDA
jgi:hypothetical protein